MHSGAHPQPNATADRAALTAQHSHLVQVFDDHVSMAEGAAAFLHEGLRENGVAQTVVRPHHWEVIVGRLTARGVSVKEAIDAGRLTTIDAAAALAQFMRNGRPDPERFRAVVEAPIERLAAQGSRIWVYGELADLLVAEGEFGAAREVEALGDLLCAHHPVRVLCGYSAVNFGHPRTAEMLRQVCRAHGDVRCEPADGLSAFLVATHTSQAKGTERTERTD